LKSFSNQLSELIFETEPFSKLIIAPKLILVAKSIFTLGFLRTQAQNERHF